MNLRWFNYIAQFGIITFFIFLIILTNVNKNDKFNIKYYSFLLISLFFIDIDIFVIIMFGLTYQNKKNNILNNNRLSEVK